MSEVYLVLRNFVTSSLTNSNEEFNFENSFSDLFNRSVSHDEAVILLLASVSHILPNFLIQFLRIYFQTD